MIEKETTYDRAKAIKDWEEKWEEKVNWVDNTDAIRAIVRQISHLRHDIFVLQQEVNENTDNSGWLNAEEFEALHEAVARSVGYSPDRLEDELAHRRELHRRFKIGARAVKAEDLALAREKAVNDESL